jgi:Uma2 family endonuclease
MATVQTKLLTVDEFYKWASRPENQDKLYELDEGRVVEMPPAGEYHGAICFLIAYLLGKYVFQRGKGYICTNDTGLLVKRRPGTVRGPDIMLFDENRPLRKLSRKFADRIPKLVVEVLSPSDQMTKVMRRISQFLKRGVPLVWLVDPEERAVTVYRPGQVHYVLREEEEVTGEDVLPGLRYRVAEFFALPGQS